MLVTGATGGIGRALVAEFHSAGSRLVVHGRRRAVVEELAHDVGAEAVTADLAVRAEVDDLLVSLAPVDVLVANAAVRSAGLAVAQDPAALDEALEVNLRAPLQMARHLGREMAARGSGHIVLVSSLAAVGSGPGSEVYSATKAGLRLYGQGLREALGPVGVGVTIVCPGYVRDAGIFAAEARPLPPGFTTVSPAQVARAVRRGIERDRAEVWPAGVAVKLAAIGTHLAPGLALTIARSTPFRRALPDRAGLQARFEERNGIDISDQSPP